MRVWCVVTGSLFRFVCCATWGIVKTESSQLNNCLTIKASEAWIRIHRSYLPRIEFSIIFCDCFSVQTMKLCTHFSFSPCQCELISSWNCLQGASFVLLPTLQCSCLTLYIVPSFGLSLGGVLCTVKLNSLCHLISNSLNLSLLLTYCPLSYIVIFSIFVSFYWQTTVYVKA